MWANHGQMGTGSPPSVNLLLGLKMPTYVFTVVREPLARCLSSFYHFQVSRHSNWNRTPPTTAQKIAYMGSRCRDFQLAYIRPYSATRTIDELWSFYDRIGTVERYDVTMAQLAIDLALPLSQVVYVTSKNSTEQRTDDTGKQMVAHPALESEPAEVQAFARGKFQESNRGDYALWRMALQKQEAALRALPGLQALVDAHGRMQARVARECAPPPEGALALSKQVRCYWNDNGCNYECLDAMRWADEDAAAVNSTALLRKAPASRNNFSLHGHYSRGAVHDGSVVHRNVKNVA